MDMDASIPGPDTIYASDLNQGLFKWKFDGNSWKLINNFSSLGGFGAISTYSPDGLSVIILAVGFNSQNPNASNSIYRIIDNGNSFSYTTVMTSPNGTIYAGLGHSPIGSSSDVLILN